MCCFRLHFSDLNVLFFQKNQKNLLQFTFEKITCCCTKREKKILVAMKNTTTYMLVFYKSNGFKYE